MAAAPKSYLSSYTEAEKHRILRVMGAFPGSKLVYRSGDGAFFSFREENEELERHLARYRAATRKNQPSNTDPAPDGTGEVSDEPPDLGEPDVQNSLF